jgi:hypothetical protein
MDWINETTMPDVLRMTTLLSTTNAVLAVMAVRGRAKA